MNGRFSFLRKHERLASALTLLGGFLFDAYFFRRIDLPFENIAIILHFVFGFIAIIFMHLATARYGERDFAKRFAAIFPLIIQFAIGGLFGKFFIFFYHSGSVFTSWPVLVLLFGLTVLNESWRDRYARLNVTLVAFYVALLVYCISVAPIILGSLGWLSFSLGACASLFFVAIVIGIIHATSHDINRAEQRKLIGAILSSLALFFIMYYFRIIPPIPLALKDVGIYHSIAKQSTGNYRAIVEQNNSWLPFSSPVFHRTGSEPVYFFAAVFAPAKLRVEVSHVWQKKDVNNNWQTIQTIPISMVGGREGGYRGYSFRSLIQPGDWSVNVETERGELLGRYNFKIEEAKTAPKLEIISL